MSGTVTIEPVGAEALDALMGLMTASFDPAFGEAWNRSQCEGIFSLPGVWASLARDDGEPAGFTLCRSLFDEAELLLIAVDPGKRGQGIGRALLSDSMETARARGVRTFHLEVRVGNPAAQLYRSMGFAKIGIRKGYYRGKSGDTHDAETLSRSLSAA